MKEPKRLSKRVVWASREVKSELGIGVSGVCLCMREDNTVPMCVCMCVCVCVCVCVNMCVCMCVCVCVCVHTCV